MDMKMTHVPLAYKRNIKTNAPAHTLPILHFIISGSNICFFPQKCFPFLLDLITFSKKP